MTQVNAKVIVNPTAAGGKVGKRWPELKGVLERGGLRFEAVLTERRGHATELARAAVAQGMRYVISVGGDGTANEVLNGLVFDDRVPEDVVLGIIPGGTGGDFGRLLGIPRDPVAACQVALGDGTRTIDMGRLDCQVGGQIVTRYFMNEAELGFGSEVCERVNRMSKRISGTLPYLSGLVMTLLTYTNKDVVLTCDGQQQSGRWYMVAICNGQFFGGGMWVAPHALLDDGLFDVIILRDLSKVDFLTSVPRVYKGTHLTHPRISTLRAKEVRVEAKQRMLVEVEGEVVGEAPATLKVIPRVLKLRV